MMSRRRRRRLDTVLAVFGLAALIGATAIATAVAPQGTTPAAPPAAQPQKPPADQTPTPPAPSATPQFTIGEAGNLVRVLDTHAMAPISATVSGLEKLAGADLEKFAKSLAVIDKGAVRGPFLAGTVSFAPAAEFIGRAGASTFTWRIKVTPSGIGPGITQVRHAQATLAGSPPIVFEYSISTKPGSAPQWTPKGATPVWTMSWSGADSARRFRVVIENQDEPLTNVRLLQSSLRDSAGHVIDAATLKLIDPVDGREVTNVNVGPNTAKPVLIEFTAPPGGGFGWFGTFDGALRFTIDGSAVTKDVELKVQASSPYAKAAGVAFAFVGILGTALAAYIRARGVRAGAIRTVLVLRHAIVAFRQELDESCGERCAGIKRALEPLIEEVSTEHLDDAALLPPKFAVASVQPGKDTSAELKTHLETRANKLTGLTILFRDGIIPLAKGPATNRDELINDVNGKAAAIQGETDARTTVQDILAKQKLPENDAAEFAELRDPTTVKEADRVIRHLAGISWLLWAMTSLAVALAWVLADVDFGTPSDLFGCLLWGFTLTTFGAGVQSLTTGSIATRVGLKLPQ
jgi:hypothetical protein